MAQSRFSRVNASRAAAVQREGLIHFRILHLMGSADAADDGGRAVFLSATVTDSRVLAVSTSSLMRVC